MMQCFRIKNRLEIKIACQNEEENHARHQKHIAHAGGEEGLEASLGRCDLFGVRIFFVVPEADEQVRTQTHDLPENEEHKQIVGHHQPQHACAEQGDVGEETAVGGI